MSSVVIVNCYQVIIDILHILVSISFHRFISGNEAHTDNTNIKQEDRNGSCYERFPETL